jgi:hypothetical protein
MHTAIAAAVVLMFCGSAEAQNFSGYKCKIQHSLELGKDGSPQQRELADTYRNMEFIIDRASGRMLGGTTSETWKHAVWDRGSDQQSFKAIYTSQTGFVHVQFLQIREFEEGGVKPFLLMDGTRTHMGTCTRPLPQATQR